MVPKTTSRRKMDKDKEWLIEEEEEKRSNECDMVRRICHFVRLGRHELRGSGALDTLWT